MTEPLRIANCSGFYGDRLSAAREMVDGGPIDVLTGDWLAELTMLILWKGYRRDPTKGWAHTFLTQMEEVLGTCVDRGIKVVTNAGGLNPSGLADQIRLLAGRLGLSVSVAHVVGDDLLPRLGELAQAGHPLTHLDSGRPLTEATGEVVSANAYLGGWPVVEALDGGADVVICPRITDASLVVGPAAWHHRWSQTDWDRLAGAVVAGHIIECGPQTTGGNYAFFTEVKGVDHPGFPLAEVAADGSSVITKHPGTGGEVSIGTVTAQLLYEIGDRHYANTDVVARFDTIQLDEQDGDRVRVSGVRGEPAPHEVKICVNLLGGWRNTMTFVLTGLDIEEKAALTLRSLGAVLGAGAPAVLDTRLIRSDKPDAPANAEATATLRITAKDTDPDRVGRRFSGAATELALAGYPGLHLTGPPSSGSDYGVYWPALLPADLVTPRVVHADGRVVEVPHTAYRAAHGAPIVDASPDVALAPDAIVAVDVEPVLHDGADPAVRGAATRRGGSRRLALGTIIGARSGDKGGNANVGLWARSAAAWRWLESYLTIGEFRRLLPEADDLEVRRFELANLRALNFVVVGLLGEGVASSTRPDPQAKGLGEYLRSRSVDIPVDLLAGPGEE
ncbi:MAG: acyclic terpene utilization AtuA family protein [Acidimicrobiales bacterium]